MRRASDVVPELERLVRDNPFRERLWGQLMVALYRCGRQADALRAFQRARNTLIEEMGIEPGPELRGLEAAILAQDPSLTTAEGPAPPAGRRPACRALWRWSARALSAEQPSWPAYRTPGGRRR